MLFQIMKIIGIFWLVHFALFSSQKHTIDYTIKIRPPKKCCCFVNIQRGDNNKQNKAYSHYSTVQRNISSTAIR